MTITINNVDNQLLQAIKSIVALKPSATITQEEEKRDIIKEKLLEDIELYRQGKLKTITLDELKEECKKW